MDNNSATELGLQRTRERRGLQWREESWKIDRRPKDDSGGMETLIIYNK